MLQLDIQNITIKPCVRMTRRGKWVKPQAKEYLASKENLSYKIKEQMQLQDKSMLPGKTPLKVIMHVYVHTSQGHRADLDNIVKSVFDSCKGIVFEDDRWIDEIQAERYIGEKECLFMIVTEKI